MSVFTESSPTTDTTQPELQATQETKPVESYVTKLAEAKGDNWKDPEVLAKGKIEADSHIEQLERQLSEMKEDLGKQDYAKQLLDELQNKAADPTTANTAMPNNDNGDTVQENTNSNVSEADLKSLVEKTLSERDRESEIKQNLSLVDQELESSFGTEALNRVKEKSKELGISMQRLQEVASESPNAFFSLIGEPKKDFKPMVQGSVRTDSVNMQSSSERNWKYYQNLRRENRNLYYSSKIQQQILQDKQRLGEQFGN
tara:strand:- start:1551 stop:2324 length:774 start_codon:yes stop_codon:yes gene_type:complete